MVGITTALSTFFGDAFDCKTWRAKVDEIRKLRTGPIDLEKRQTCLQALRRFCDEGEDWVARMWLVQLFSVRPCLGEESEVIMYVSRNDRSHRIRVEAARYVARNYNFYEDTEIHDLLTALSIDEKQVMLQVLWRRGGQKVIDALLEKWWSAEDPSLVRFAYFGSTSFIERFLESWGEWLDQRLLTQIVKFHPSSTVRMFVKALKKSPGKDSTMSTLIQHALAVLRVSAVPKEEMLCFFKLVIEKLHCDSIPLERIGRVYPEEVLHCVLQSEVHSACKAMPKRIDRYLKPERFVEIASGHASMLDHVKIGGIKSSRWVTAVWIALKKTVDANVLKTQQELLRHLIPKLPRKERMSILEVLDTEKMSERDRLLHLSFAGEYEAAKASLSERLRQFKTDRRFGWETQRVVKDLYLRFPEHVLDLVGLMRTLEFGAEKDQHTLDIILDCICSQPWHQLDSSKFPKDYIIEIYENCIKTYHWRNGAYPVSHGEKAVWQLAMDCAGQHKDFATHIIGQRMAPEAYFGALVKVDSQVPHADFIDMKMREFRESLQKESNSSWRVLNLVSSMLREQHTHRCQSNRHSVWPIVHDLLSDLLDSDGFSAVNMWSFDRITPFLLHHNGGQFRSIIESQIEKNHTLLESGVICRHVLRQRMDILDSFFSSDMRSKASNQRVPDNALIHLGSPEILWYLPHAWQVRYAEALIANLGNNAQAPAESGNVKDGDAQEATINEMEDQENTDSKMSDAAGEGASDQSAASGAEEESSQGKDEVEPTAGVSYPYYPCRHQDLITVASLPAVPWDFLVRNVIEFVPTQLPEWLARRGIYALAHVDDSRACEYLSKRTTILDNKDSVYAIAPKLSRMPAHIAMKVLKAVTTKQISVYKQVVRTIGALATKEAQLELFRIFKEPSTHNHVRIAVIRGLWPMLCLPSTWDFLEEEVTKVPAWNVCRKVTEITTYRLSLASRDRLMRIFGKFLCRNEKKLTMAVLQRYNCSGLNDPFNILCASCLKVVEADSHDRISALQVLLQQYSGVDESAKESIRRILVKYVSDWAGQSTITSYMPRDLADFVYRTAFDQPDTINNLQLFHPLLVTCPIGSLVLEQMEKVKSSDIFVFLLMDQITKGQAGWRDDDRKAIIGWLLGHSDPRFIFAGLLVSTADQIHNDASIQLYKDFLEKSEDPYTRSWCKQQLKITDQYKLKQTNPPRRRRIAQLPPQLTSFKPTRWPRSPRRKLRAILARDRHYSMPKMDLTQMTLPGEDVAISMI